MNNREFVNEMMSRTQLSEDEVKALQEGLVKTIAEQLSIDNSVAFQGFGNFELKVKAERRIYSPSSRRYNVIPEHKTVAFRISPTLKEKINNSETNNESE